MIRLDVRPTPSLLMRAVSPLIAFAVTIAAGALLFLALGKDPAQALSMFVLEPFHGARALSRSQ